MTNPDVPNFGELLAPFINQVPESALPNFLALLERIAAQRYRTWAELVPQHRQGLLACAAREDEIADCAERLFPLDEELREVIQKPLPAARNAYFAVFAGLEPEAQMAIQADAELQGAASWRAMLSDANPESLNTGLEYCAGLEETSSAFLRSILA